jgi:hypothetical protein
MKKAGTAFDMIRKTLRGRSESSPWHRPVLPPSTVSAFAATSSGLTSMSSPRARSADLDAEALGHSTAPYAGPTSLPPEPATVLAASALARRRLDPAAGGQMCHTRCFCKPALAYPAVFLPPCEELRDHAVVVEGLGSLSLPPLEVFPQAL